MERNRNDKKMMAIFLDFKRAFETIDREVMLSKLYTYGIRGNELKYFQSYLTKRRQTTKAYGSISNTIINDFGVPQGSILGALLFIIYINVMPNILEKSEMVIYADDTLLIFTAAENDEECRANMTQDINKINQWLKINKLKLNENKTKILEMNMTTDELFKINNTIIEKVENKISRFYYRQKTKI